MNPSLSCVPPASRVILCRSPEQLWFLVHPLTTSCVQLDLTDPVLRVVPGRESNDSATVVVEGGTVHACEDLLASDCKFTAKGNLLTLCQK